MNNNVTIVDSLSDALKCQTGGLCIICPDCPPFDPNDKRYFTPDDPRYIEAERLPPDWLALVGKTVWPDRTTVGTIADLLEELPPDVADEWRRLYAASESDDGGKALDDFEQAHGIMWYGEGYYLCEGDTEDGDAEDNAESFALESATPSQLAAEKERQRQREEIARRLARPLKGSGPVNVQPQLDVGQTGQMDLFAPIIIGEKA